MNELGKIMENTAVQAMRRAEEVSWANPKRGTPAEEPGADVDGAERRLLRFRPYIQKAFPEVTDGVIESPLREIHAMKERMKKGGAGGLVPAADIPGTVFLKCDSELPISGSVKARGGIYEILKLAETIAKKDAGLKETDNYAVLAEPAYRTLFSKYKVAVGSTGNLGLSIGIMSAKLGFSVTVHMSADARAWKKNLLREKGVTVIEYENDYSVAVKQGREEAAKDPTCHFVDDEHSLDLFEGYAVAGRRLKKQLADLGRAVDENHRLYVYLPCGVGGAPGGIAYGLYQIFGGNVYPIFAEPTHAPALTLGLVTGLGDRISATDIGLDGKTEADGLAVSRCSSLVAKTMRGICAGCYTAQDERLFPYLAMLKDEEGIFIEPSACISLDGPRRFLASTDESLPAPDENSIHVAWATGGSMVPEEEKSAYYERGEATLGKRAERI